METPNQYQFKWREWVPALIMLSPAIYVIGTGSYREYRLEQKKKSIDKLPSQQLADEIRIFQSGTAYKVERKREKEYRYPVDYVSVDYSPFEGIAFAEFTRYATGMFGLSLVDTNADGHVDLQIEMRRSILSSNDRAFCFENLSECNDKNLKDRITKETKRSERWVAAQAQYETGLQTFLKDRYTK